MKSSNYGNCSNLLNLFLHLHRDTKCLTSGNEWIKECVCVCVCVCVCMCVCVCVCVCVCMCVCVCVCVCVYVCACAHVCLYMCVCMCMYVCACMCVLLVLLAYLQYILNNLQYIKCFMFCHRYCCPMNLLTGTIKLYCTVLNIHKHVFFFKNPDCKK